MENEKRREAFVRYPSWWFVNESEIEETKRFIERETKHEVEVLNLGEEYKFKINYDKPLHTSL